MRLRTTGTQTRWLCLTGVGRRDAEVANRVVCPGGVMVVHDPWEDRRYADLSDAVEQVAREHGWNLAEREDCTSVYVLPMSG